MFLLPRTAFAQTFSNVAKNSVIHDLVTKIMNAVIIPIIEGLFLFTFLMFVWGVVNMIRNADSEDGRKEGRSHVLWGVIGMVIMISAYGIIRLIANTVGAGDPFQ